jgi:uncharacterized damage-inducible protein DinB
MSEETSMLLSSLNNQREHVLGSLEGLPDEGLRRAVLPTGWSCLGLVQHLALDVERFWFRGIVGGDASLLGGYPDAWQVTEDVPAGEVLARYRSEIDQANAIISATSAQTAPAILPSEIWPSMQIRTVRQVMLHVITETACHAGHLDAARELIDGQTWLVLPR